jgi:hypothetical protein
MHRRQPRFALMTRLKPAAPPPLSGRIVYQNNAQCYMLISLWDCTVFVRKRYFLLDDYSVTLLETEQEAKSQKRNYY